MALHVVNRLTVVSFKNNADRQDDSQICSSNGYECVLQI